MDAVGALLILAVVVERFGELILGHLAGLATSAAENALIVFVVQVLLGIVGAVGLGVDLFTLVGLKDVYPLAGVVFSGVAVAGGAAYVTALLAAAKAVASKVS